MTPTRWFISGLLLMVLSLQSCGVLQTTPYDATLAECSKSGAQPLDAQGAKPPCSDKDPYRNSLAGGGFP